MAGDLYETVPQRLSNSYTQSEKNLVNRILDVIEKDCESRSLRGLNENSFFLGVLNCMFVLYMFGAFPGYFWLVWALEGAVIFYLRWQRMIISKPKLIHSWLDFCWVVNFTGYIFLVVFLINSFLKEGKTLIIFGYTLNITGVGMSSDIGSISSTVRSLTAEAGIAGMPLSENVIDAAKLGTTVPNTDHVVSSGTTMTVNQQQQRLLSRVNLGSTDMDRILAEDGSEKDTSLVPDAWRKHVFAGLFGVGCGTLQGAAVVLGNAMIFHDVSNMASVMIHLGPSALMYTLRWHTDEVEAAAPGVFQFGYFDWMHARPFGVVYTHVIALYGTWVILFAFWNLAMGGYSLHKGGEYDTIFNDFMSNKAKARIVYKIQGKSAAMADKAHETRDWTKADLIVYLLCHFMACMAGTLLAVACLMHRYVHGTILFITFASTIKSASKRYVFYMIKATINLVKKEIGTWEAAEGQRRMNSWDGDSILAGM